MSEEIKKIGHNIDLKNLVIHQVIKEQGSRPAIIKKAKHLITIEEKEKLFIGRINKVYRQKSNPIYGIFGNEDNTFKDLLNGYLRTHNFYTFSIDALKHYKKILEAQAASTGGFVIFAHFINTDYKDEYLLVLTINNKNGYVVNDTDLTINDSKSLELNKIDVACMINISKWRAIEKGLDKESKTYLSFVKGNKDVSHYFMSFIDCNNKQTGSEATQKLVEAMDAYCEEYKYDRETKISKRNDVYKYCNDCVTNKKEIQLAVVSALLNPEKPNHFQEFASDEKYGVSAVISGDKTKIKPIKYVIYKGKKMSVEFDCDLLNKDVVYDSVKKSLTLKNLPQELISQIPK